MPAHDKSQGSVSSLPPVDKTKLPTDLYEIVAKNWERTGGAKHSAMVRAMLIDGQRARRRPMHLD